jgi:hypothetical protein
MNLVTPKGGAKHELLFNKQTLISTQPCMLTIEITVISIMPTHAAQSKLPFYAFIYVGNTKGEVSLYLLFDWFGISCMTTDN